MTTIEIARIADARASAKGWIARCPAHADRTPSLAICEGRDGRTLIRCHAGCAPDAIASALGLSVRDLFADERPRQDYLAQRALPRVTADDVERCLEAEIASIVSAESKRFGFDVAELARHRNKARAVVERRFRVSLKREVAPWFEVDPYCADPAWRTCIDQALNVAAAVSELSIATLGRSIADMPNLQQRALKYARRLQSQLADRMLVSRGRAA